MCGRYTLSTPDPTSVRRRFPIGEEVEVRQRFNVAPGDPVLAVTTDREGRPRGELLSWGLVPTWAESPKTGLKMINARAETVAERPAFRTALQRFRCLIPADGFYEWQTRERGGKQPHWITLRDRSLFAFAGLWSIWRDGERTLRSCTILTTRPNEAVAPLHDRMPVILRPEDETLWLDHAVSAELVQGLLAPLPSEMTALTPVGPAVNDARYDGPECLAAPVPDAQGALF